MSLPSNREHSHQDFLMRVPGLVSSHAVSPDIFLLLVLLRGFVPWLLWPCLLISGCSPVILSSEQLQLSFEPSSVRAQASFLPAHCHTDSFSPLPAFPVCPFLRGCPGLDPNGKTSRRHASSLLFLPRGVTCQTLAVPFSWSHFCSPTGRFFIHSRATTITPFASSHIWATCSFSPVDCRLVVEQGSSPSVTQPHLAH